MKRSVLLAVAAVFCFTVAPVRAEMEMPKFPGPTAEHQWLQKFVGEWESETESYYPGQAPIVSKGTENVRAVGGFWTVAEISGDMMNQPFTGNMTIGFDTVKQKYVATWVDSMMGKLWQYEGSVDATGKVLTLETEGVCPMKPDKMTKFKEVIEFTDSDHKKFTSYMLGEDGQWVMVMSSKAYRVH